MTKSAAEEEKKATANRGRCKNCGWHVHTYSRCPAADKRCHKCQKFGHFHIMCDQQPAKSQTQAPSTGRVGHLRLNRARLSTIAVDTKLEGKSDAVSLAWIPDTGSDVDAIGLKQLRAIGGDKERLVEDEDDVRSANGERLKSVGKISANLSTEAAESDSTIHVYEGLSDALLSQSSLQALGFLPPGWPGKLYRTHEYQQRLNTPSPVEVEKIKAQLMEEFADVFNDTPLRPMKGPPMEIELKMEAVPFRVHGPRVMPYAYRDQVKAQIEDMVAQGIIEPVSEASDWCHPIVVVDKKGTAEKRLAVDFKKLNDQVRRPTHPTHSPRDVSKIGNAKYFTKMDARHGYWQVPLSESAKPLTTFMTPWGRFRFLRNLKV